MVDAIRDLWLKWIWRNSSNRLDALQRRQDQQHIPWRWWLVGLLPVCVFPDFQGFWRGEFASLKPFWNWPEILLNLTPVGARLMRRPILFYVLPLLPIELIIPVNITY